MSMVLFDPSVATVNLTVVINCYSNRRLSSNSMVVSLA